MAFPRRDGFRDNAARFDDEIRRGGDDPKRTIATSAPWPRSGTSAPSPGSARSSSADLAPEYLTFRRGRRLITGVCGSRMEAVERDGAMQEAGARSASSLIR